MDFRSSWVIRQKGEFRKCVYQGVRNIRFSENFGVLCFLETPVLPFALLPLLCCLICLIASLPFCQVFSLPIWITNFIITIWITKSHILIFQNRECWKLWDIQPAYPGYSIGQANSSIVFWPLDETTLRKLFENWFPKLI